MKKFMYMAAIAGLIVSSPVRAEDVVKETETRSATALTAKMIDAKGQETGQAVFTEVSGGVLINLSLSRLTPGWHGVHIHEHGTCGDDAAHFKAAGGHLADADQKHGFLSPKGPHKGDLPNMWIGPDGTGKAQFLTNAVDLQTLGNTALMVHAGPDDYLTDPAGNSGDRIACGIIQK